VDVPERGGVGVVVRRRPDEEAVCLAGLSLDEFAVARFLRVGVVQRQVVLAQVEQFGVATGALSGPEGVNARSSRVTLVAQTARHGENSG
jgi:hypothetical protein